MQLSLACARSLESLAVRQIKLADPLIPKANPDQLPHKLGSHILKARLSKGLSVLQASYQLKVNQANYLAWEVNTTTPKAKYYSRILEFIGYCPIPEPFDESSRHFIERVYLRGWTKNKMAKYDKVSDRTVTKRENR